ncbi:MAG: hypothetical protein JKP95_00700 [Oceanicaulis sp.]|nr:hypothetical protein [Oceanicaulis sp.]
MRRRLSFNARQNALGQIEMAGVALADYEGEEVMRMISGNHGQARLWRLGRRSCARHKRF